MLNSQFPSQVDKPISVLMFEFAKELAILLKLILVLILTNYYP